MVTEVASQAKSKKFIENYLYQKGIEKIVIQEKFKDFENDNCEWEKKSAFTFAKKKKLLETNEKFEKKLGKMARAGFSYELCKKILKWISLVLMSRRTKLYVTNRPSAALAHM